MKNLKVWLALVALVVLPWTASASFDAIFDSAMDSKTYEQGGGDGAPWPFNWGSECPFPWSDINGNWKVIGERGAPHSGEYLQMADGNTTKSGTVLYVDHIDQNGERIGSGFGRVDNSDRIAKVKLRGSASNTGLQYRVLIRSYSKSKGLACKGGKQVLTVTFCSLRGKKCLTDSNYRLVR